MTTNARPSWFVGALVGAAALIVGGIVGATQLDEVVARLAATIDNFRAD
jgi:hypothetical protein